MILCQKKQTNKQTSFDSLLFDLFPEFENSSRQTGRVTYDFHSPGSFDTGIAEWASAKENPEMVKIDTLFRPKPLKDHTHWGSTYLGVALSGWAKDVINISHNINFEIDLSVFIFSIGVSWIKE